MNELREAAEMALQILRMDVQNKDAIAEKILEAALRKPVSPAVIDLFGPDLPARIKTMRMNAGLSQAAFAARIGVSPALVGQWERGECNPSVKRAKRLLEAMT